VESRGRSLDKRDGMSSDAISSNTIPQESTGTQWWHHTPEIRVKYSVSETRSCLRNIFRHSHDQARAKCEHISNDPKRDLLEMTIGDRIIVTHRTEIIGTHNRDTQQEKWSGYAKGGDKVEGEFSPDVVDMLTVESKQWNYDMTRIDPMAQMYAPCKTGCFWWPAFILATRAAMVRLYTSGSRYNDGSLRWFDAIFSSTTTADDRVVLATVDWKAAAAVLLTLVRVS